MNGNVAIARIVAQEIGVIRVAAEQRAWAKGDLARILILFQERRSVRDGIEVEPIQEMPALRSHICGIQNEFEGEPGLVTEVIVHDHRKLAVLIQAYQAPGLYQGICAVDLFTHTSHPPPL